MENAVESRPQVKPVDRLLLSAETVARVLDVSVATVYAMIRDGRLPSVLIDGTTKRLVPQRELHDWVRELVKKEAEKRPG